MRDRRDDDPTIGMAERIRRFDWSATPFGPIETWPDSLRFLLSLAETSSFPTAIYWGDELRLIYNDAWAPIPGERHPDALGRPAREVWHDIWHIIEPQFRQVLATRKGLALYDQMLPMLRGGQVEQTWWNYSFTPVIGADGEIQGILNQGHEITAAIVAERRLSFQIEVADGLRGIIDPLEAKRAAAALLGRHLGAARVGFVEVDEAADRITLKSDWTRSPDVPSLSGRSASLSDLPKAAIEYLRTGQVLAVADVDDLNRGSSDEEAVLGGLLGVKAVITVPLVRDGQLKAMLFVHEIEPRQWQRSEAAMARDVAERSWAAVERAFAEQGLRASEDHYRHTVELNPQVSWTALPDGQLNRVAPRWFEWTGTTGLGESWAEGLHPEDRERTFEAWARSVASGEPYDVEHRVKFVDGRYRWARSRAFPRRDAKNEIMLWYGTTEDIHERKIAEERQRLLINELNHRVKNSLATVQAIAFQTLKGDISLAEARSRFEARLLALSHAHNMLTDQNWEGAPLRRVVAQATEHLADATRMSISGEDLWLAPRAALALSLALHELATNAAKYGALSGEGGNVAIAWTKTATSLHLEWKEQGGPPVSEPAGRGFGSRLIERGLSADLGGTAHLAFEPDGLRCTITASLAAIRAPEASHG